MSKYPKFYGHIGHHICIQHLVGPATFKCSWASGIPSHSWRWPGGQPRSTWWLSGIGSHGPFREAIHPWKMALFHSKLLHSYMNIQRNDPNLCRGVLIHTQFCATLKTSHSHAMIIHLIMGILLIGILEILSVGGWLYHTISLFMVKYVKTTVLTRISELLPSGNQTWLAGKSTIYFDDFPSERNLHFVRSEFPAPPGFYTGGQPVPRCWLWPALALALSQSHWGCLVGGALLGIPWLLYCMRETETYGSRFSPCLRLRFPTIFET